MNFIKKWLIISFILSIFNINYSFSQELNYKDLSNDSISKANNSYTSYISKDGFVYKVGDKIKIGFPSSNKTFAFIEHRELLRLPQLLNASASGQEVEIKSISIKGSKRTGFIVTFITKGDIVTVNYFIQIENALAKGEIVSSIKSSDEAIAELKKAKEKLDLGVISKEEYEKIKQNLIKYIK